MTIDRRAFIKSASTRAIGVGAIASVISPKHASAATPTPLAQEVLQNGRSPIFNLGLAAYSFKPHFKFYKGKIAQAGPQASKKIDMFAFIDYCAEQGCGAELTSYFFPPDADDSYFKKIKRYAFVNGVPILGTAIGNNFTIAQGAELDKQIADAKRWIDRADQMGAPHIRFFAGKRKELEDSPETMKIAIGALQECVDYAAQAGIFIGVENHGDLSGDHIIEIIKGIKSDWFGVNLDTGNFVSDDPYAEIEQCAPFAVNVQVKIKMKSPHNGEKFDADLDRIGKILKNANYRGSIIMEYEEELPFENVPAAMDQLRKHFAC